MTKRSLTNVCPRSLSALASKSLQDPARGPSRRRQSEPRRRHSAPRRKESSSARRQSAQIRTADGTARASLRAGDTTTSGTVATRDPRPADGQHHLLRPSATLKTPTGTAGGLRALASANARLLVVRRRRVVGRPRLSAGGGRHLLGTAEGHHLRDRVTYRHRPMLRPGAIQQRMTILASTATSARTAAGTTGFGTCLARRGAAPGAGTSASLPAGSTSVTGATELSSMSLPVHILTRGLAVSDR